MPKVTLGLPVYNGERFLEETLESLLAQTFTDFELIIADNASTDGTAMICARYAARDHRIRYIRHERNLGAAYNYNYTVKLARGRYFKWCAADDTICPNVIERCVAALDERADAVIAHPSTVLIDDESNLIEEYAEPVDLSHGTARERFWTLDGIGLCNPVFGLIRTDVLRQTRMIRPYPPADTVLLFELVLWGAFVEVNGATFRRRIHDESSSADKCYLRQRQFYAPDSRLRPFLPTWRSFKDFFGAVHRAPVTHLERARLYVDLFRRAVTRRHYFVRELRHFFFSRSTAAH